MNIFDELDEFFSREIEDDFHMEEIIESKFVDVSFFPYMREANDLTVDINVSYYGDMYEMAPFVYIHFQRILITIKSRFIYRHLHRLKFKCEP